MFISDSLVFVELHKTGGSHIGRCLNAILKGRQVGKHNAVPPALRDRFILGSIRNPWDWYVSLWAFGCDGNGSAYRQSTRRFDWPYYWRQLNKEMGKIWLTPSQYWTQIYADTRKPVASWSNVYRDSRSPELFRAWLKLILNPERRYDIGEGYGFSPISSHSGLLTYRVFKLFTCLGPSLYEAAELRRSEFLSQAWEDKAITNFIVRNESLEDDLITALGQAGVQLTGENLALINEGKYKKTNASTRGSIELYYDKESIDLVRARESFIIRQFGYEPPAIGAGPSNKGQLQKPPLPAPYEKTEP